MSLTLRPQDIADLYIGTLANLGEGRFTVLAEKFRECVVVDQWFAGDKVQKQDGGNGWRRQAMVRASTNARHSSVYAPDVHKRQALMAYTTGNFVHMDSHMLLNYQEILDNSGQPEQLYDLITSQRAGMIINIVELLEAAAWSCPDPTDTLHPWGIPYWIVYNHNNEGFTGGAASGYTLKGGLDPNQIANNNWKNWSGTFTNVTSRDFLVRARKMLAMLNWKSPIKLPSYARGSSNLSMYAGDELCEQLTQLFETRNDNLGLNLGGSGATQTVATSSLVSIEGTVVIQGRPVIAVPILDTDEFTGPDSPLYCIDHAHMGVVVRSGDYFREGRVIEVPNQHNCFAVFMDLSYQFWSDDVRRHGVLAKAAS